MLPVKSYASIVSGFKKIIAEIDRLTDQNYKLVVAKRYSIETLKEQVRDLEDETNKALQLKTNITNFIGG